LRRIAILLHEHQPPDRPRFLIYALGEVWQQRGLEVSRVYGIGSRPGADLLIPQIDLTHTPREYLDHIRSFPRVVNRDVGDISKRRVSAHLLRGGEDYGGPVIVKSDLNSGGRPEHRLFRRRHPVLARLWRAVAPLTDALGLHIAWRRVLTEYRLYDRLADVPARLLANRAFVVERFLPEREGGRYCIRHYLFLGDHTRSVRVAGPTPLLKRASCELVDEGLPVPDAVVRVRRELGLDYGKIDYTLHDGQAVVLDVARTPNTPGTPAATARTVADLADGIWSLLPGG